MPSPFHRPGLAQPVPGAPVIGHLNTGRGRIGSKKHAHGRGLSIPAQGLRHIQRIRHHRGRKILRPGKYVKYNKYAAARHAARNGESTKKETKVTGIDKEMLKEALRPKFGKSLGRSAVAQRLASSPKSAALRKTSKNNPLNKAKRAAARNKPKGE